MARLIAIAPAAGLGLPLAVGAARLVERELGPAWSIAPFRGRESAVARALGGTHLPAPGRVERWGEARLMWFGPGRALLVGRAPPDLAGLAAVTEQGDGTVAVGLEGQAAADVLARLLPIDGRAVPEGGTARTLLGHMTVQVSRLGPDAWELLGMRSMAGSLVHEVAHAMRAVAARAGAA